MTTTEVTSFLSTDEPESISFQDSLRFFRRQLADPAHFRMTTVVHPDRTPEHANEDGPKCCRISIPTVDSILESVRVLRAIQKSQSGKDSLDHNGTYSTTGVQGLLKADSVLNSHHPTTDFRESNVDVVEDVFNNSNETSNFWPKSPVDTQKNLKKTHFPVDHLKYFNDATRQHNGALSDEVANTISEDTENNTLSKSTRQHNVALSDEGANTNSKDTENNTLSKSVSDIVLQVEYRTESVSSKLNGSVIDDDMYLIRSKDSDQTAAPKKLVSAGVRNEYESPLSVLKECELDDLRTECVSPFDVTHQDTTLLNGKADHSRNCEDSFDSLSIHTSCPSSGYSSSVVTNQFLQEETKVQIPNGDENLVSSDSEQDSYPVSKSEKDIEVHQTLQTGDSSEASATDKEQVRCQPSSPLEQPANEGDVNIADQVKEGVEVEEEVSSRKYTTSSWDLVSIVKFLFTVERVKSPKILNGEEEASLKRRVFVLSRGAFSQHSEGEYTILLKERTLSVLDGDDVCLVLPFRLAELSLESDCSLLLDNKVGKCLHLKCESQEELEALHSDLSSCLSRSLLPDCIDLVHYPLKCHQNVVIIDLGSCSTRAGILMDQPTLPTLFFPSVCATNKITGGHVYGLDALEPKERQNATISFPLRPSAKIIKHSVDVDQVTGIFRKIFKDLRINPENYAVLVCLPRSLSINVQNAIVNVLLEDLNVKAVSLSHQAILTMYAHDVSTGIVLDIGDRMDVLPVIDGFIVDGGVTRLPYGGRRLIHHMKHALAQKHISLSNDIDSFVVEYISQKLSYVAEDYEKEASLPLQTVRKAVDLTSFARDDSCLKSAVLDDARFKVPEGLFQPEMWGLDSPGVHQLVQKAIQAAGVDARKKVAENIYLSGGVTLVPGFVERLLREVTKLNEPRITPKVHASSHRCHSTFIGACRLAKMAAFPQVCLTKEEYFRHPKAALKKFALCV